MLVRAIVFKLLHWPLYHVPGILIFFLRLCEMRLGKGKGAFIPFFVDFKIFNEGL